MREDLKNALWGGAIWIPAALIAGMVAGGYGPKRDLERTRAELDWVRAQAQPRQARLEPIMQMVAPPPVEPARATPRTLPATNVDPERAGDHGERTDEKETNPTPPSEPPSLAERLETARDLWQLRTDIARNTFVSRAALDRDSANRFDVLMAAMNLRIRDEFEAMAAQIAAQETFTPEDVTRMVHQITGALALTYDEMDRVMPVGWRTASGPELDLFDFIDPSVAEPLLEVESLLDAIPAGRAGGGRRW